MKKQLVVILVILTLSSCATREEILYFQNLEKLDNMTLEQFEPTIQINDVLDIQVSSLNEEVVRPFLFQTNNQMGGGGGGGQARGPRGYLVEVDGTIRFPVLGSIEVLDKTRRELEEELTTRLRQQYVTDAVVRVRIVNFRVTVMGEIGSSVVQVPDERITIPELLAMSGDIPYTGKRENILIIRRDNEGNLTHGRVDITDVDVFENPFFYLKQNDIVYVEPTYRQVKSAGYITDYTGFLSILSSALGLLYLFTR